MEPTEPKKRMKFAACEECGAGCRSDWVETTEGVVWLHPRCKRHKPGARERQVKHVKKYEQSHGVNDRVYSFINKNGETVRCKKAYWYRAKKQGKFACEAPA